MKRTNIWLILIAVVLLWEYSLLTPKQHSNLVVITAPTMASKPSDNIIRNFTLKGELQPFLDNFSALPQTPVTSIYIVP